MTADIVPAVAADVAEDWLVSCKDLVSTHGLSIGTVSTF
jgi:hypothetical protein